MRRSKSEIYLHFVWATYQRLPLVTAEIEQAAFACIQREAQRHGCEVLALGGMPDHTHLLLKIPSKHSPSALMQRIKGGSSAFVRDQVITPGDFFGWQDNYGVFSVTPNHRRRVVEYIQNQKRHHTENTVHPAWEETDEAAD